MDIPDSTTLKRCSKCGEYFPADKAHFNANKTNVDGLSTYCKECHKQYAREWYQRDKERLKEKARQYYSEHKEQAANSRKRWAENNRERKADTDKAWYEANRDRRHATWKRWYDENREWQSEQNRRRYIENKDRYAEAGREWYQKNRDDVRRRSRQWAKDNPDKRRAQHHARRARKVGNGGTYTAADLAAIRTAQTDKRGRLICWACGKPIIDAPHLDHWIPLKHGGRNDAGNLHFMHAECNTRKNAKHPTEIGRLL